MLVRGLFKAPSAALTCRPVSEKTAARIAEEDVIVVPTLIMMRATAERRSILPASDHARNLVSSLHKAGATIVPGSDANSGPGAPAAAYQTGIDDERVLRPEAGLSRTEALRTATGASADGPAEASSPREPSAT